MPYECVHFSVVCHNVYPKVNQLLNHIWGDGSLGPSGHFCHLFLVLELDLNRIVKIQVLFIAIPHSGLGSSSRSLVFINMGQASTTMAVSPRAMMMREVFILLHKNTSINLLAVEKEAARCIHGERTALLILRFNLQYCKALS